MPEKNLSVWHFKNNQWETDGEIVTEQNGHKPSNECFELGKMN